MSSSHHNPADDEDEDLDILAEDDAQEILEGDEEDGDVAMDSDGEGADDNEEILLHNDSIAYFDTHKDSVFAVAQHPLYPNLIATGGSEGDADDAPGKGYVIDTSAAASRPVLPPSYNSNPAATPNTQLEPLFSIDGHTDSINALAFTLPNGDFLVSAGLDGRLRVHTVTAPSASAPAQIKFLAESQETEEINWLLPCPSATYPNTIALGASDGSVWVLTIDPSDAQNPLQILQSYFLHTASCTAGTWSPDGLLLATVSEDASLHVFDVWGVAAAASLVTDNGQTVVSLTESDQRFFVDGGLYSVAIAPTGAFLAAGGASGAIRIVGLPRLSSSSAQPKQKSKAKGGKSEPATQAGTILAALGVQSDGIESLAFSPAPGTLLAAGSVDGSIAVFDTSRSFAVRRHIRGAHDDESVVKVDFVRSVPGAAAGWLLTSCGLDGAVRRWDLRGATAAAGESGASGLGETGERVVTAGDDALVLVFEA